MKIHQELKNCQQKKSKRVPKHLEHINLLAAGIDIGATSHFVAVPEGVLEITVREFSKRLISHI